MNDPLISCIVPVYNGERYLGEALDSILAQTYRPLEIIVVDDGSTDGTPRIAGQYRDRIRYLRWENRGPAAARNRGVTVARGEFIAFLDADDLWHQEKLRRQIDRFKVRQELEISVAHFQNFWVPELSDEAERFRNHPVARPTPGYTASLLMRRRVFETVGALDESLFCGENIDWILRARDSGLVIELLPDVLTCRRLHPDNFGRRHPADTQNAFLRFVKASLDRKRGSHPAA